MMPKEIQDNLFQRGWFMKKGLIAAILALMVGFSASAADFSYLFGDLGQHADIGGGLVPTFVTMGTTYTGLELFPEQKTEVVLLAGGGYTQRRVWQDPVSTLFDSTKSYTFDTFQLVWNAYLEQGFGVFEATESDLLTAYIGYEGRYEANVDPFSATPIIAGEKRTNVFADLTNGLVYPDLKGNHMFLSNVLVAGVRFDAMQEILGPQTGFVGDLSLRFSPRFLNSILDGEADYLATTLNVVGTYPVYAMKDEEGLNFLSVTLVNRINVDYVFGSQVPVFAQEEVSLGRKVRGFAPLTYNTRFSLVNNFDVRINGPEPILAGVFPQLTFFLDMGVHAGKYFNSTGKAANFIASTGAQFTINILDSVDFGYYVAYLLQGQNYYESKTVVSGAVLQVAF
jgi:hypothetical protein